MYYLSDFFFIFYALICYPSIIYVLGPLKIIVHFVYFLGSIQGFHKDQTILRKFGGNP